MKQVRSWGERSVGFVHEVRGLGRASVLQHLDSLSPILIMVVKNLIQQHGREPVASAEIALEMDLQYKS